MNAVASNAAYGVGPYYMNDAYYGPSYHGDLPVSPINIAWIVKDYYDSIAGYVKYFRQATNDAPDSPDVIAVRALTDAFNESFIKSFSANFQVRY